MQKHTIKKKTTNTEIYIYLTYKTVNKTTYLTY